MLFKSFRHLPRAKQAKPVMVHINYHPGAPALRKNLGLQVLTEPLSRVNHRWCQLGVLLDCIMTRLASGCARPLQSKNIV